MLHKNTKNIGRKTEGKIPLGRTRRRWKKNIRINVREIGWKGVFWMHLAQVENNGSIL
jgi:hypothetical protein